MSKPESGLFKGTSGIDDFYGDAESIIASRVKGLDLSPHPITQKQLSSKKRKQIEGKIENRTATKKEYSQYMWNRRFQKRRKQAIKRFWVQEKARILIGLQPTRPWSAEQRNKILNNQTPRFNGVSLQAHHSYSASEFPHLANLGEVIYPATNKEHLKAWHGGNYKKSIPGKRIKKMRQF